MPGIARGNAQDIVDTEHGCATTTTTNGCSTSVFVNGIGVHRQGDLNNTHTIPCGDSCCEHAQPIVTFSETVLVDGLGVARIGDRYSGCGHVASGSETVFAD